MSGALAIRRSAPWVPILACAVALAPWARAIEPLAPHPVVEALENAIVEVIDRSKPAVVTISARDVRAPSQLRRLTDDERIPVTSGSGFMFHTDGYILTNAHVVQDAQAIEVRLVDGRRLDAELTGYDLSTDIAVLHVDLGEPAPVLPFVDDARVRVGQFVLSIGSPFSLDFSVTVGIVSATGRADMMPRDPTLIQYQDFVQTDAYINRGNSGGPLLNLRGEVVGMNSMIRTGANADFVGLGFAIPAKMLQAVAGQLIDHGAVQRGWLGISLRGDEGGIRVNRVLPDSPAAAGGLQAGDLITALDDAPVGRDSDFRWAIANSVPGRSVRLSVSRDDGSIVVDVVVGEMPPQYAGQEPQPKVESTVLGKIGATGRDLPPGMATIHGFAADDVGVFVLGVRPGSPAHEAGLLPGDLIVGVAGAPVRSVDECERALADAFHNDLEAVDLSLKSRDGARTVSVPRASIAVPPQAGDE
ncbi:PDZ domain-containing protein [Candidatus Poribacteria bacterium]|nr:PDZ domain-containing protein [Candidatus Poribacteria bacterium]